MSNGDDAVDDRVSRRRYLREKAARAEAEMLLEAKSRELYIANQQLSAHSALLETAVFERTKELEQAFQQAEAAGKAKSRFIATMSHEIRTPLGGMLGMIDLLAIDEVDESKLELLNHAVAAGKGLSRIVNDVLDFSKMEAGVFIFDDKPVDIRALLESTCKLADSNETATGRSIRTNIRDNVPQLFLGDATRLRQIISNLVTNALRYSKDGPVLIRASAQPHTKGALLRLEVEDFGIGIAPESISNLFKDFSQISNPLTAAAEGAGLGLAICKRILDGCGGTIGVESTVDEGSTFWFELPVTVIEQSSSEVATRTVIPQASSENVLNGKRILIAEDNIVNQKLITTYLRRMGTLPQLAENGRVALEMFEPDKFDLVLMDIAMPVMDGLEATRQIRLKWKSAAMPPIIALTAHVMDAIDDEVDVVGIDTVLSKPIPFEELKHALEEALTGKSDTNAVPVCQQADRSARSIFSIMKASVATDLRQIFPEEKIVELAQQFTADSIQRVANIAKALENSDTKTASTEAHSMKGAALTLGFTDCAEWARQIEKSPLDRALCLKCIDEIRAALEEINSTF